MPVPVHVCAHVCACVLWACRDMLLNPRPAANSTHTTSFSGRSSWATSRQYTARTGFRLLGLSGIR